MIRPDRCRARRRWWRAYLALAAAESPAAAAGLRPTSVVMLADLVGVPHHRAQAGIDGAPMSRLERARARRRLGLSLGQAAELHRLSTP